MEQHRLADAARAHEHHRPAHPGFLHETCETLEVRARLQLAIVVADSPAIPPRVFGAHAVAPLT